MHCLARVLLWVPATSPWGERTGWKPTTVFWFCSLGGLVCRQFRHLDERAVRCGGTSQGDACVTPHTPLWQLVLALCCRRSTGVGERWGTIWQEALAVPQGFYFFCWLKSTTLWLWDPHQSASAIRYSPEGTACGWSGQPPAAEAPVRLLTLVLSRLLYGIIPAQSEPWELLSFACLSCCPWLIAVHGPPQLTLWWEREHKERQSWPVGILRDEETLM